MPDSNKTSSKGRSAKGGDAGRAERLAAELRENLKKRKELARAREKSREAGPSGLGKSKQDD